MQSLRRFALVRAIVFTMVAVAPCSAQQYELAGMRSPSTAVWLSTLGTVVPIGLGMSQALPVGWARAAPALAGLMIGPSMGYFYAGEAGRAMQGIGLRLAVAGASVGIAAAICGSEACDSWDSDAFGAAGAVLMAGLVTTTTLAIIDITKVDNKVRARNERLAESALSVGLTVVPETQAPGLQLTLRH